MDESLGHVQLKSGETVQACVVTAPHPQWMPAIRKLLGHKPTPWDWHIEHTLLNQFPVCNRFYLLHRDGVPLANIMTSTHAGVGIFGHVFTVPQDRRKGAAALLATRVMQQFRERDGGQAMYLITGYDTPPFHIYRGVGFQGMEPRSGFMAWYRDDMAQFEQRYFAAGPTTVEPLDWPHWVTASPLFCGCFPGTSKAPGLRLIGRGNTETPLMHWLAREVQHRAQGGSPRGYALCQTQTQAVLGIALLSPDPMWPAARVLDVYCHPAHWHRAADLLEKLPITADQALTAYADPQCPPQVEALQKHGFRPVATLRRRAWADAAQSAATDVILLER